MSHKIAFDFLGSTKNVISAVGACPALDTGAGIYKYLKTLDSRLRASASS